MKSNIKNKLLVDVAKNDEHKLSEFVLEYIQENLM